jgi:tripartite-type tricarboxylate transporter receptor subunit TctC
MNIFSSTLRGAAALLMATSAFAAAAADKYPTAPVRMLVGTPAGGTTDIVARLIAAKMGETLGASVVVYNKPGASGLIAADYVGKAAPDGYTLLMASSQLATYRALYPTTTFDPEKDLAPIGLIATSPYVLVVHPSLPVKSFAELIAYARAHPGKISYAGSTPGTAQHLGWEIIKRQTGTDMRYVPYKGTGELMPDLLAGRLQAGIDNVAVLTPYIKSGQLRGIAVTSAERTPLLPDLPTIAASGVPGFRAMGWFGVFATKKTPPAVLAALRKSVRLAMSSPQTRTKFAGMGAEPQSGTNNELATLLHSETTVWTKVIKESHITFQ